MATPIRQCPHCGAPRRGDTCPRCGWESYRSRRRRHINAKPARPDLARPEWRRRSNRELTAWRAEHGDWCPGWPPSGHPPHDTADLTLHHHTDDPDGPASVLCRDENARLGRPGR